VQNFQDDFLEAGMGRAWLSLENESLSKDIVMMTINNSHDDYTNA
jgi:hypothetical protein